MGVCVYWEGKLQKILGLCTGIKWILGLWDWLLGLSDSGIMGLDFIGIKWILGLWDWLLGLSDSGIMGLDFIVLKWIMGFEGI